MRPAAPAIDPHAEIRADGQLVAGAGRTSDEWVMQLSGRRVAATESASMLLAMLHHVASGFEARGQAVRLIYSTALREAATREADAEGRTLEQHLQMLEDERKERLERPAQTDGADDVA